MLKELLFYMKYLILDTAMSYKISSIQNISTIENVFKMVSYD